MREIKPKTASFIFWLIMALLWLAPAFSYSGLGLVDDAQIQFIAHDFARLDVNAMAGWLRETSNGRFRPFYTLGVLLYPLIGGNSARWWVLLNVAWLIATLGLAEKILRRYLSTKLSRMVLLGLFLWPAWAANWYRFGTAEPRQLVFLLLTWLWLAEGKRLGAALAWLAALWSKETTILFLPATLWWGWFTWPRPSRRIFTLAIFIVLATATWWLIPVSQGYSHNVVSWQEALHILFVHAPTAWPETYYGFILTAALGAMILGDAWRKKQLRQLAEKSSFALAALSGWLPVLVWRPPLERYLFSTDFFLTLTLVVGAQEWWWRFRARPTYWYFGVLLLLSVAIPPWQWWRAGPALAYRSGREIDSWVHNYAVHGALTNWLLTNHPSRLYIDSTDQEYSYAIGLYASEFKPNTTGITVVSSFTFDWPIYRYSSSPVEAFRFECNGGEDCVLLTNTKSTAQQFESATSLGRNPGWWVVKKQ